MFPHLPLSLAQPSVKGSRAGFFILRGGLKDRSHARVWVRWGCLTQPFGQKARVLDPAPPHKAPCSFRHVPPSPLCRPEEDPFLLLESTFHAVQEILARFQGGPLRRSWMDRPYGEEEITLLEEEVLPALKSCLARIGELDEQILSEMEILPHCRLENERIQIVKLRPTLG